MTIIIDPDDLTLGTSILINETDKRIQLISGQGSLSNDGVTGQALYSFLKDQWKSNDALIPYPFPMLSITPEQFEFIEGWKPLNDATRNLLRFAGWREIDADGDTNRQYMNITSLGDIDGADTAYFSFEVQATKTPFSFAGRVNQGIQVFADADETTPFDHRTGSLTTFIRTKGKIYGSATTESIGLTGLNYIANRFPLAEAGDPKISGLPDADMITEAPYSGMTITYGDVQRTIGTDAYPFKVVIDGNDGTAEQIYEFVQYKLRQNSDIDAGAGTVTGALADELLGFLGNTLKTKTGVYIDSFNTNDTNRIEFVDNSGTTRTFPFVASGNLNFNQNLVADADAKYAMFFADTYGLATATIVKDASGDDITGTVAGDDGAGRTSISFDFDYDGNVQQGRTAGQPAAVIVVAIGLNTAQYVSAAATIGRSSGQNISLVAPLERNYSDPA